MRLVVPEEAQRGTVEVGSCGGSSSGDNTEGFGENVWASQEEDGEGKAAVEGPGSSEERKRVVDDWESKVLDSESVREKGDKEHHSG